MNVVIEQNESTIHDQVYLDPQEMTRLYEIAQAGASRSVHSLRDFLGSNTDIHLNCLSFLPLPILVERIRLFYPDHLGFHLRFSGEINGEIYTLFREQEVNGLIHSLMGYKRFSFGRGLNRVEVSALTELVNILSNSFWRVLTEYTSINWWINPPARVNDLSRALTYSAKVFNSDHMLIHLEYLIISTNVRIQFIILPSQNTIRKILDKLGPKNSESGSMN